MEATWFPHGSACITTESASGDPIDIKAANSSDSDIKRDEGQRGKASSGSRRSILVTQSMTSVGFGHVLAEHVVLGEDSGGSTFCSLHSCGSIIVIFDQSTIMLRSGPCLVCWAMQLGRACICALCLQLFL